MTLNGSEKAIHLPWGFRGFGRKFWVGIGVLIAHGLMGFAILRLPAQPSMLYPSDVSILSLPNSSIKPKPLDSNKPPNLLPISAPLLVPPAELNLPAPDSAPIAVVPSPTDTAKDNERAAEASPQPAGQEAAHDWQGLLGAWIRAHKVYPPLAQQRGQQGVVTVEFEVMRTGHVSHVRMLRSSGVAILDEAAVALLTDASVPAFTPEMQQNSILVTMTLDYSLRERH